MLPVHDVVTRGSGELDPLCARARAVVSAEQTLTWQQESTAVAHITERRLCFQVTKDNIHACLEQVTMWLQKSSFIAFDLELSGLKLDTLPTSSLDDMRTRFFKVLITATSFQRLLCQSSYHLHSVAACLADYRRGCNSEPALPEHAHGLVADGHCVMFADSSWQAACCLVQAEACASHYSILQLGLSCFCETHDGCYEAATFNFVLFPGELHGCNTAMSAQLASFRFLARNKFNFNFHVRSATSSLRAACYAARNVMAVELHLGPAAATVVD